MKRLLSPLLGLSLICLAAASCSNTRVLSAGQYRLASNRVEFEGNPDGLSSSDVSSYIKQQTNNTLFSGWVYNWSNPEKDDWLNNALRKIGTAPVIFNGSQVGSSCENIARHLDYLGYYNSEVTARIDTVRKNVKVSYSIVPGKRSVIDSIVFKLPEGEFRDEFDADMKHMLVKKGDWLSEKVLEKESERGASYFRNKGYYDFSKFNYFFEADTLGKQNILTYEIRNYTRNEPANNAQPLRKYNIGKVEISHSKSLPFREKVLRDINIIHPGDPYSESLVDNNYKRYTALRVFNNVSIEMTPVDSTTVDCHISMGQGKTKGIKLNLEASTNSNWLFGISPAISFYNKNAFRGGEWLSLGFSGNFQRQLGTEVQANEFGVTGSLSFPRFLGLPYSAIKGANIPRTVIQTSFNYQNRPEFQRYIASGSYGYNGGNGKFFYQLYPFRVSVVKCDMDSGFLESILKNITLYDSFYDHIDAGISGQIYWTTDASVIPQKTFTYARLSFDLSGNVISLFNKWLPMDEFEMSHLLFGLPYSRYGKIELTMGRTFRFSPSNSLAVRIAAGATGGFSDYDFTPFEKQFYVGGASSMRGWQVRTLGPGASEMMDMFAIPSQIGDTKLEFDLEYRQSLFWKLEGAVFAEAGNIWDFYFYDGEDVEEIPWIKTIAADWGVGLRLNMGFILLRLDWGLKLYEPSRAEGSRWLTPDQWFNKNGSSVHFGVGYPF